MEQTLNYSKWYFEIKSEACPDLLVDATTTMWGSIFDDFLFPSIRVRSWPTMRDSFSLLWKLIKISFTHTKKRDMQNLPITAAWTYGIKFVDEYHSWFTLRSLSIRFRKSFTQELFSLSHMGFVYRIWTVKVTRSNIFQIMSKNTVYNCTCQH